MRPARLCIAALITLDLPFACAQSPPASATGSGGNGSGGLGAPTGAALDATGGHGGATVSGNASGGSGSDGVAGRPGDDRRFVPEDLPNTNVNGKDEGLTLIAFSLVPGANGPELYAAARNDGDAPACQPGMTTDFYDKADQRVTSAGSVLQTGQLYRMADGTIISCVAPGQIAMAASTDLPDTLVIDELGYLKHLFPTFILQDLDPIDGLTVSDVHPVATGAGQTYSGKLTNGLDVAVSAPEVMIFPVNRVGRPLGVATSSRTADIPAGGSWTFVSSSVDNPGVAYLAFPSASISQ